MFAVVRTLQAGSAELPQRLRGERGRGEGAAQRLCDPRGRRPSREGGIRPSVTSQHGAALQGALQAGPERGWWIAPGPHRGGPITRKTPVSWPGLHLGVSRSPASLGPGEPVQGAPCHVHAVLPTAEAQETLGKGQVQSRKNRTSGLGPASEPPPAPSVPSPRDRPAPSQPDATAPQGMGVISTKGRITSAVLIIVNQPSSTAALGSASPCTITRPPAVTRRQGDCGSALSECVYNSALHDEKYRKES